MAKAKTTETVRVVLSLSVKEATALRDLLMSKVDFEEDDSGKIAEDIWDVLDDLELG